MGKRNSRSKSAEKMVTSLMVTSLITDSSLVSPGGMVTRSRSSASPGQLFSELQLPHARKRRKKEIVNLVSAEPVNNESVLDEACSPLIENETPVVATPLPESENVFKLPSLPAPKANCTIPGGPVIVAPNLPRLPNATSYCRNSTGRMAPPTSSNRKLTGDVVKDFLLVSRSSDPKASITLKDGEVVDEEKLKFICNQDLRYPSNVNWLQWNNSCFKIEYLIRWIEEMMEIQNGSLPQKRYMMDQLTRYVGTVCMKMKSLAENLYMKEKFTTAELFYMALQPISTSMQLENQRLIENMNWSINLLNNPAKYSRPFNVQPNGTGSLVLYPLSESNL